MIASDSWLNHLAIRRATIPERLYWIIFALLLLSAAALRIFWVYVLEIPFVEPDSYSYIQPIVTHWLLPFSPFRTSGTSMFLVAALAIFRNPSGILILNGVLAVGSAALLAVAIKSVLREKALSLLALFVVAFTAKNITFEYYLLSEHYGRVLYVVYAALMLWYLQDPRRLWMSALIGLSVTLNILVKPSAVVLIVATLIAFVAVAWTLQNRRRQIAAAAAIFLATTTVPVAGYMLAFKARYGTFGLTQYDGINQFSHIGHLMVLDGGKHPVLKQRLKPLLAPYAANYAAKGNYRPNWLIYGTTDADLQRDFGDANPIRTISDYVFERYGSRDYRWINEVCGEIALEAMLAHPVAYLRYAAERAYTLWKNGYGFAFHVIKPSVEFLQTHRDNRATQRTWYYGLYGEEVPACSAAPVIPARAAWPLTGLFHGAISTCAALPYEEPSVENAAGRVDRIYRKVTNPVRNNFAELAYAGAAATVVAGAVLLALRGRRARNVYAFGLLLALVLLGYTLLHGLVNDADPQRMTTNVQDYVVLASLTFVFSAALSIRRVLLYAVALRRKRK
jgi:hypothetical protein